MGDGGATETEATGGGLGEKLGGLLGSLGGKGGGGGLARRPPAALPVIIHSSISFLFSDR